MYKILVVDDEIKIRQTISDYFSAKGLVCELAADGMAALKAVENYFYDLIILDVMMPVMDGIRACREIRAFSDVPVLFLSALGEEEDLLKGLSIGADDYVVKPFPLSVLYQKCLNIIRRCKNADVHNKISVSGVTLDLICHKAYVGSTEIKLALKDYQLLEYLMMNKGIALDRELILNRIWGYDFDGDVRVVDTHIKRIRKALGSSSKAIKTVIGVGYRFEEVHP